MARRTGRRVNDGKYSGIKQDKFRNSKFDFDTYQEPWLSGTDRKTINTMGGVYVENRGRRSADDRYIFDENPFEVGELHNWNRRKGWDQYFDRSYDKAGNRSHGGSISNHDIAHRGKGPKGYSRSDESIFEDVCESLTLSPDVDASEIEVSVKEGCVYLNGSVESRAVKRMAELEIENISGVKDVQNLLSIDERNNDMIRPKDKTEQPLHH